MGLQARRGEPERPEIARKHRLWGRPDIQAARCTFPSRQHFPILEIPAAPSLPVRAPLAGLWGRCPGLGSDGPGEGWGLEGRVSLPHTAGCPSGVRSVPQQGQGGDALQPGTPRPRSARPPTPPPIPMYI